LWRYWVAIVLPLAALSLQWWIEILTGHTSYQLLLAAVALCALQGGVARGLIALLLSGTAEMWLGPRSAGGPALGPLVLFVALGLSLTWVAGKGHSTRRSLAQALCDVRRENEIEAELRHSREMHQLGRFAAGVAHDLNNLLTLLRGYSDMLRGRLAGFGQRSLQEPLEEILNASDRGARLASRLLAFSRQQAPHLDQLDPGSSRTTKEAECSNGQFQRSSAKPAEVQLRDGSIIVAEDDKSVRKLVSSVLRANNYVVLEAKDGAEALRIASWNVNSIALVIADAALPLLTARRLVDRLRILRPDIQVIYTSADGDPSNAGEAGARFLQKPFGVTALLSTVEAMLGQPHQRA
jgi:CheY-like chemotaxis protein